MSQLRQSLDDYLTIRRALGFKLKNASWLLPKLVAYLEQAGAATVTTDLALAWAKQPEENPIQWSERLKAVRGFARHLQSLDPSTEVPPTDVLLARRRRSTPYLYGETDIAGLMRAARALVPPLRAATYETLVGLLAVTGMRVSEAIHLDRQDLDWSAGILIIRLTKFKKSREVPLHPSTVSALRAYERRRDEMCYRPLMSSFFVNMRRTRLSYRAVNHTFVGLVKEANIELPSGFDRLRLHDLRHSFAVRTLFEWYRAGLDVQAKLPLLSTYLGHFDPKSTYWYLSASPELLALASERLEHALEVLS